MKTHFATRNVALAVLAGLASVAPVQSARADIVFTVDSTLDQIDDDAFDGICHTPAGTCTLRAAVMQANRMTAPIVMIVLPAGLYGLTRPVTGSNDEQNGDLDFLDPGFGDPTIVIHGAGASTTVIDANQIDRVIDVGTRRTIVIESVTLRGGRTSENGGGINVRPGGSLTINDGLVTENTTTGIAAGGGGANTDGYLTLVRSEVRSNAAYAGGGLASGSPGTLSLSRTTVAQNYADLGAGLILQGAVTISQSAITENIARLDGGGLYLIGGLLMLNSTVAANIAGNDGGGVYVRTNSAAKNLYNVTIAYNGADSDQDFVGTGGGIHVFPYQAGSLDLYNTLVAGNTVSASPQPDDCRGIAQTHAQNLFGSVSGCTIVQISGSWAFLNALSTLGPLQDNGGPTATIALLAGSNAIDAGNPGYGCRDNNSVPIAVDQRDRPRDVGICDLGAYEYGAGDPDDRIFASGFE